MEPNPFNLSSITFPCTVDKDDDCAGFTKLHRYVMLTRDEPIYIIKIKKLLSKYLDLINMQNNRGWTALMLAAANSTRYSTLETVELLLDIPGINLEIPTLIGGNTALGLATGFVGLTSNLETVRLLLSKGANIGHVNYTGDSILQFALKSLQDKKKYCIIEVVELFIGLKIDLDNQNKSGSTALRFVARLSNTEWFDQIIIKLITSGANINIKDDRGHTALMGAARYAGTETTINSILTLVNAGADVNMQAARGETALMCAVESRNISAIRILINAGSDLLLKDDRGKKAYDVVHPKLKHIVKDLILNKLLKLIHNTVLDLECMICLDSNKINTELPCGHRFHSKCITEWLNDKNTCPVCRREFF